MRNYRKPLNAASLRSSSRPSASVILHDIVCACACAGHTWLLVKKPSSERARDGGGLGSSGSAAGILPRRLSSTPALPPCRATWQRVSLRKGERERRAARSSRYNGHRACARQSRAAAVPRQPRRACQRRRAPSAPRLSAGGRGGVRGGAGAAGWCRLLSFCSDAACYHALIRSDPNRPDNRVSHARVCMHDSVLVPPR